MRSPIMLPPTPDLHPIRQELLRWASARHSSDVETAVPRHGPKNRGSWDPHLGQTARAGGLKRAQRLLSPTRRQRIVRSYVWRSLPSSGRVSRGPPVDAIRANSGPSGLNLVGCVFGAGRWPPGAGHHRRPLPRPDWSYQQWWRWLWPEESIWLEAVFTSGRATSRCPMRSGEARSSRRSWIICDRGRIALARLLSPPR